VSSVRGSQSRSKNSQEVFKAQTWCCKNNSKSRKRSY